MTYQLIPEEQQFVDDFLHIYGEKIPLLLQLKEFEVHGMVIENHHITKLYISFSKFPLPSSINNLQQIRQLYLCGSSQNLFNIKMEFPELIELKLVLNDLTELPSTLSNLKSLEKVTIDAEKLIQLDVIGSLANLKYLKLIGRIIPPLPPCIQNLPKLSTIILDQEYLTGEVPPVEKIDALEMGAPFIYSTLPWLSTMIQLKNLHLMNFIIIRIPESPTLEELIIDNCYLLDRDLTKIEYGHFLNQYKREFFLESLIFGIPQEFNRLPKLKRLKLRKTDLLNIRLDFQFFSQLETLSLGDNQMNIFPVNLHCTHLRSLNLAGNYIDNLPEELGKCIFLEKIYLSGNRIESLSSCIGQLTQLQILKLDRNPLSVLPPEMAKLLNLVELTLEKTKVRALPDWLTKFPKLLIFNPPKDIILTPENDQVLAYLRSHDVRGDF